jgi:glycosyltransferase involved in cell wall biosynthesis
MSTPRVSIGMPVYNGADCIADALDSLLAQTFDAWELVISDNASTDDTQRICQAYARRDPRIRYYRNPANLGACPNFNRVFALSPAPYFKWFTHDDKLAPDYLKACVRALDEHPDFALCFPRRRLITHDGQPFLPGPDSYYYRLDDPSISYQDMSFARIVRLHGGCFPMLVFGLMRSELLRRTRTMGAFWAADLVLVAEVRLQGRLLEIPEILYIQRLHAPTPLWKSRQKKRGEAAWFDPRSKSRMHPELRLFVEYLRGIRHARLPMGRSLCAYAAMAGQVEKTVARVAGNAFGKLMKVLRRAGSHEKRFAVDSARAADANGEESQSALVEAQS